jgi:subtilisin-like proprotein convertase family protein
MVRAVLRGTGTAMNRRIFPCLLGLLLTAVSSGCDDPSAAPGPNDSTDPSDPSDPSDPDEPSPDGGVPPDDAPTSVCGDGVVEGEEVCDGDDLDGETCLSLGYAGGTLRCSSHCGGFRVRGCIAPSIEVAKTNLGLAIPDNAYDGSIESMTCTDFEMASAAPVYATPDWYYVTLGIDHTWVADLVVKLVSPTGRVETLLHRPGLDVAADDGSGAGGRSADLAASHPILLAPLNVYTTMAEDIGVGLTGGQVACKDDAKCSFHVDAGVGPSELALEPVEGTWRVCVGDAAANDVGTLRSVTLDLGTSPTIPSATFGALPMQAIPDDTFDGTNDSMSCRIVDLGERAGTPFEDLLVRFAVQHPSVGDLVFAMIADGVTYGLMSRPGIVEDADGFAAGAGSQAGVSSNVHFSLGHPDLVPAEQMGVGVPGDDEACGGDEDPCVFAADSGSLPWPRPVALLGDVLPQSLVFCVADAHAGETGTWVSVDVRIDFDNTVADQVAAEL